MEKLYYVDAYMHTFDAVVTYISEKGIALDKTAFFPEGGGQPCDTGSLGGLPIYDVQEENGVIFHKTKEKIPFSVGDSVKGEIDMKKRFSNMQNHSGEHIVSGIIHNTYGYENVGFHLNDKEIALDFSGVIPSEDMDKIELEANRAVWQNINIRAFFPSDEELKGISYRSKKEIDGDLRLVEIEGVDVCACCAPHVMRTGEIGIIKVVGFEKHRGGTRIYILCGERALKDYGIKQRENKKTGILLKTPEYETSKAVEILSKKKSELEFEVTRLNIDKARLSASAYEEKEIIVAFDEYTGTVLTRFADFLSEKAGRLVAAFGKTGENSYQYMIISKGEDISDTVKAMNSVLCGRGGGKNGTAQGSVNCTKEQIVDFFADLT